MFPQLNCIHSKQCSGCGWIEKSYEQQRREKTENFRDHWQNAHGTTPSDPSLPEIKWVAIANGGLRDRVDLMIDARSGEYHLGLFDQSHREILDLRECPQMSDALADWHKEFRNIQIPVSRGSIRLRVSPTGQRGVWLDLANIDVKKLLDERSTLDTLRTHAIVEIGQRRKRLVEREGSLKLTDPTLEAWFETYAEPTTDAGTTLPLYCTIGSFTQPGFTANRALLAEVHKQISPSQVIAEFGSGIGNFTLPLATISREVHAYEVDTLALTGLQRSAEQHGLTERIKVFSGNFQVDRKIPVNFSGVDLILADPPRSGLMKFLDPLEKADAKDRPPQFVYVSCFAESFAQDAARLAKMGYRVQDVTLVDQFPQSHHYEIVSSFRR